MKNKGWVKLWRDQFSSWISEKKPWCDGYAWSYLYAQANHKKGIVNFGKSRNEYINVERGQFITSKLKLGRIFGWGRYRVDSFINALKLDNMITYETNNRYILITIINYEKYQQVERIQDNETNNEPTSQRATSEQPTSINKNVKNVKNKKDITKVISSVRLKPNCELIINYLNKKTGRNYDPKNGSNIRLIRARFKEGRTVKDLIDVIDKKARDWLADEKWSTYLRPSTLFDRTKFENYINEPEPDKYSKYYKKE